MANSHTMVMLVYIVMFYMTSPIFSQEVLDNVAISPTSGFEIYIETPDEAPSELAESPAEKCDPEPINDYSQKQLDFLRACAEKSSSKCGDEIFNNLVDETATRITDRCCLDILKTGKDCYLGVAKIIFSIKENKEMGSKAIPRSKQTWNNCVHRVGNKIGTVPVSLEQ
ncbi:hypothetical protein CARUB_v10002550mg [Capsella rubella]|uniref:Prolamin-like domain-containing protein n=1 Tax=Capsella rubella TaxID=81985 RepID=R0FI49_9BRAS|nr:protein DOWN-REGULATED IN DIF1 11 [Capsella rubella]EOA22027.1 hypothetical protein CARUB_v10002550mg [Capsella rubella]